MTTPAARRKAAPKKRKTATKRQYIPAGASPISGFVPPPEHRFKPGNQAAVGHGRPRTLQELRELILETLAEETGDMTRARLLVRTMLVKSPSDRTTLLEYAFGKVKQPVEVTGEKGGPLVVQYVNDWRNVADEDTTSDSA